MEHILQKIGEAILIVGLGITGLFGGGGHVTTTQPIAPVGATIPVSVAVFQTSLQASITSSATSMTLVSGTDKAGNNLSGYICFNIDEGTSVEEFVCGTTSGTTVSSMIRGIDPVDGDLEVSTLKKAHRRGASVKITNYPSLAINSRILNGQETIPNPISYSNGVAPLGLNDLTDKEYVLSVVSGGAVTTDKVIVAGTAGETVSAGKLVYLKSSDSRWWVATSATASTVENVVLGIAQGSGTAGNLIAGGILLKGLDTNQTGLTANTIYYASTAGGIATTAGTYNVVLGISQSTTGIMFIPRYNQQLTQSQIDALAGGSSFGTPSSTNKFITQNYLDSTYFGDGSDGDGNISGTTTLTSDKYYNDLVVTGTLNTANWRVFVKGTLSGNGTIQNNGGNGGNGGTPTAGTAGTKVPDGYFSTLPGYIGGLGVNGGTQSGAVGTNGGASSSSIGVVGVAGGDGEGVSGAVKGTGGTAGTKTSVLQKFGINTWQTISALDFALNGTPSKYNSASGSGAGAAGSGRNNGNTHVSGGGGGSGAPGGIIALFVNNWTGTTTLKATGGNGGNGGDGTRTSTDLAGGGGGGGGGSGGTIYVVYKTKTWTGSYVLTGGTGGTKGTGVGGDGDGTNGANGTTGVSYELNIGSLF